MLTKRASTDGYETAKTALIRMNQYKVVQELRPAAETLLAADIKKNGSYEFLSLAEGILTNAPDRKEAVNWVLKIAPEPETILGSTLLNEAEKKPFCEANIANKRATVSKSTGEVAAQAKQDLRNALSAYATYLDQQSDPQEAWNVLHEIEPKTERSPSLLLELAAKTGRLSETFAQYNAGSLEAPSGEQVLFVAALFNKEHTDWSLQIREWEYHRELSAENPSASAYFGMAQVRIDQKRTDEALALLRDVTLTVDMPFQNLSPAIELLEKAGLVKNAADYAHEWRTAEPWNPEAVWAVARTTEDKSLLDAVRNLNTAEYGLRAEAARTLRVLKAPANGTSELDLLTHATISPQEAEQPFFVLARLRAKRYAEAIALKPSLKEARLALAESVFLNKKNALGMAAWNSYETSRDRVPWLHSSSLERAMDQEPDQTVEVEELVAGVLTQEQEYGAAEGLYRRILEQTKDANVRARIAKLLAAVNARAQIEQENRSRAPVITTELAQAGIVKPRGAE
jgi:hypothetical protein